MIMSLVSFKRACENFRVLTSKFMLMLFILLFSQSMSNRYYLKFLMVVLQGYSYCRSCVHKLIDIGELF